MPRKKHILNGVLIEEQKDSRNYNISMFVPGKDIIADEEFCLKLPQLDIILNQTKYSACVGHAFATAKSILEYNRTNKWIDFDPFIIYGTRYDGEYDGIGMYPHQGAQVLLKDGAIFRRNFNIQSEVPELLDIVKKWKTNNPDSVHIAKDYAISGYFYVYDNESIKSSLKNGMPISVAYPLYNSFFTVGEDGRVPLKKAREKLVGYHQMLIVGWTKDDHWIVINSWGNEEGFKGMYLIPFDYQYDSAIAVSDTITPSKYKAKEIIINTAFKTYKVDGETKKFDVLPYIKNDRTYVPVRFITEALGASVEWIPETKEVIVRSEEAIIKMKIGYKSFTINDSIFNNDVAPEIKNDRTMLPIRMIAEVLNCEVLWESGKVIIRAL